MFAQEIYCDAFSTTYLRVISFYRTRWGTLFTSCQFACDNCHRNRIFYIFLKHLQSIWYYFAPKRSVKWKIYWENVNIRCLLSKHSVHYPSNNDGVWSRKNILRLFVTVYDYILSIFLGVTPIYWKNIPQIVYQRKKHTYNCYL